MKKLLVVGIIILLVGMSIPTTGINIENKSLRVRELEVFSESIDMKAKKIVNLKKHNNLEYLSKDGIKINDEGWHPDIAGDLEGQFLAGFEITLGESNWAPAFWYSPDGITWEESGCYPETTGAMYPDVDSNNHAFFATFGIPPEHNRAEQWLIIADDPMTIFGVSFDWSLYGFDDFNSMSISCHSHPEFSNYGGMACTGYNGYSGDIDGCPFIFYPTETGDGTIEWLFTSGCLNADFAIDEITGMSYAVYDHETDADLLVRKDNFGIYDEDGHHPYIGAYYLGLTIFKFSKPSVEAYNDSVVIVAEVEDNIDCYYSNNGGITSHYTSVVESATNPEVISNWDGDTFVCSYIKGGNLYRSISIDGGATWIDEEQIKDNIEDYNLGKSPDGIYAIWTDDGVYFDKVYSETKPDMKIISIKGLIGVTATIKNVGDAPATDINWTMKVNGGKLDLIDKTKYGKEDYLEVGQELPVKSGIILGFGKIKVIVSVTCEQGASDEEDMSGMQVFFLSLL